MTSGITGDKKRKTRGKREFKMEPEQVGKKNSTSEFSCARPEKDLRRRKAISAEE